MDDGTKASRSFTDPLSNIVVLSSVDIRRHAGEIQASDLPLELLPTFLHEMTHHWCFGSPVGIAQILLFYRARRTALQHLLQGERSNRDRLWTVADAVIRYEFAQQLMQPLAEGIALFAEHDASTGHSDLISEPLRLAGTLFAQGLAVRSDQRWRKLPLVLAGARLTPLHIRRKADLLLQPLACKAGGYLPGYLATKNLWMINLIHLKCSLFFDTDFFLNFFRSYFYDDWSMVAYLLDDSRSDIGALAPIADHLQQRMIRFATDTNRPQQALDYNREGVSNRASVQLHSKLGELTIYYDSIGDDGDLSEVGKKRLQALFQELFDEWPADDFQRNVVSTDITELNLSHTITIGEADLEARVKGDRLEFIEDSERLFWMSAPEKLEDGWSGTLGMDFVVNSSPTALFVVLTLENDLVAVLPFGKSDVPEVLRSSHINRRRRLETARLSQSLVKEALDDESVEVARNHARKESGRLIERVYLSRALAGVSKGDFWKVCRATRKVGFLSIFEQDLRRLADAAAVSLCAPLGHTLESLSSFHEWAQENPYAAAAQTNSTIAAALGFAPFLIDEQDIVASFI